MPVTGEALSVILPVYNEEDNLELLHTRLTDVLKTLGREYEVIYVDDGSRDRSWSILKRLSLADQHVRLVRLRKNFGQTPALAAGFAHSRNRILVTMDADLQNDPGDIPALLRKLEADENDLVSGWRRRREDRWLTRRVPSQLANWLIRVVTRVSLHDFGCTLKAYRREVVQDLSLFGEMHRFLPVLITWVGGRVAEMEVTHHPRIHGVSKYGLLRTYKVVVDLLTLKLIGDFSARPNYVFSGFGLTSLFLGLISFAVVAYRVLVLHHYEATPLVFFMTMFILTGILSIFMGFLAEIVIRGLYETQRKPAFYVRDVEGQDRSE